MDSVNKQEFAGVTISGMEGNRMSNGLTNAAASNQKLEAVRKVIETYKDKQGCLIAVLHLSQEIYGYLPEEVQRLVAEELGFSPSYVSSVVSFYSFFSTTPRAQHEIKICLGTACYVKGGKLIVEKLEELLGVSVGETTPDGRFSILIARCLGACGLAPVIMIDNTVYQKCEPSGMQAILDGYKD